MFSFQKHHSNLIQSHGQYKDSPFKGDKVIRSRGMSWTVIGCYMTSRASHNTRQHCKKQQKKFYELVLYLKCSLSKINIW
jgi:hypothetical protein